MERQSTEKIKIQHLWPKVRVMQVCTLLLAERLFGAMSLYYLAKIGTESSQIDQAYDSILRMFVFYFLKVLMLIPNRYFEVSTSVESYFKALDLCTFGQAGAKKWANRASKDTFQSAISYQLFDAIRNLTNSYREIFNFLVNYAFSFAIFGVFLNIQVILAFGISLLISLAIYFLSRKRTLNATEQFKHQEITFYSYISSIWNNVLLNNQSIMQKYQTRLTSEKSLYKSRLQESFLVTDFFVFGLQNLSWIPVIAMNIWVLRSGSYSLAENLTMILLIPKQIELLEGIRTLNQMFTFWNQDRKIFEKTISMTKVENLDPSSRINLKEVFVDGKKMESLNETLSLIKNLSSGRVLVTGSNGAGKTSLLIYIHDQLDHTFYLPSTPDLYLDVHSETMRSTGQRLADHLDFLLSAPEKIILLDEWDANLDSLNKSIWSKKIDEIAKQKVVVEIRH